jgi:uncharacterized protein (DUF924 family)
MGDAGSEEVLSFWFGPLDQWGQADQAHVTRWWRKDPAFDAEVRARFGALHQAVLRGEHEDWLATPRGRLAYLLVLDQFSRNMFRDSPRAFAADERALEVALDGIAAGMDRAVGPQERGFFYMPLMHSERLDAQDRCVELMKDWTREPASGGDGSLRFAEQHREIIRRFGRFPHRNLVLRRTSTDEEIEFLQKPGSSF